MAKLNFGITRRDDIANAMLNSYLDREDWRRNHLGASLLGHRCDRYLWLTFRWAKNPNHSGRMLRLFDTGKLEEARVYRDLTAAGMSVMPGKRIKPSAIGPHLGGSPDGYVLGVPDSENTPHLLEIKTHSQKSFDYLKDKGLKSAKPEHFVQMLVYMRMHGWERGLYVAVCKNTDEIYVERVVYDGEKANDAVQRGLRMIEAESPPERLDATAPPCVLVAKDGTRYPCQFFDLCHGDDMPERNCRTCAHSTPTDEGWYCGKKKKTLWPAVQRRGCGKQVLIPDVANAQVSAVDGRLNLTFANGVEVDGGPL